MKRFSKILNKVASLAMTAMIAFCASGCSDLGADEPSSAGDGCGSVSISFSHGRAVSYDSYTDIKLFYKASGASGFTKAASWASERELSAVSVPVGTYTFKLTATLASNVSSYKKYHITFVDTLESGKFSAISALTIKVDGTPVADVTGYNASITGYAGDVAPTVDGFTQTIEFTPATGETFLPASLNGKTVTIEFTATLGTGATIGMPGNENKVKLEYSNNPNDDQGGEEGNTPEDKVKVFTYKLTVNKVEPDGSGTKAKTGANFTLYKEVPTAAAGETQTGTLGSAIKADFDSSVKATALADDKYYVEVGQKTGDATGSTFSFNGVDDGNYVLVETTIPAGYNGWEAVAFEISAKHDKEADTPTLTELKGGDLVTGDFKGTGIITTDIENKQGSVLPSTGGIGTTIFYIVGAILVLGAGIVLVTRRRMSAN